MGILRRSWKFGGCDPNWPKWVTALYSRGFGPGRVTHLCIRGIPVKKALFYKNAPFHSRIWTEFAPKAWKNWIWGVFSEFIKKAPPFIPKSGKGGGGFLNWNTPDILIASASLRQTRVWLLHRTPMQLRYERRLPATSLSDVAKIEILYKNTCFFVLKSGVSLVLGYLGN